MTPTQRPTFSRQVIGDGAGFVYLLASGGASASINFDFTTGSLPAGITFTRASIGTYNSSGNLLITAGNDVARLNYVAGVSNLLIEPAATNLLLQSNGFGSSPWVQYSGGVLTAAQFVSPDGTNNGWSLNNPAGFGGRYNTPINFSTIPYTMSVWAKQISGTDPIRFKLIATISSATVTTTLTRVSGTITASAAGNDTAYLYMADAATNGTNGIYGAQLEAGSKMTSYIPTTTAAVTRAADSATFTVPTGINQLVYTFDDNTTQLVAVSAGSYTIPTTLNRPNIKSIVGSA